MPDGSNALSFLPGVTDRGSLGPVDCVLRTHPHDALRGDVNGIGLIGDDKQLS